MKKLLNAADLSKAITSIARRGAKLDSDIQLAGLSALALGIESGTWNWCADLANAMPQGSRVKTLTAWMQHFAPVSLQLVKNKGWQARQNKKFDGEPDLDGASETFWAEFQKDRPEKPPFSLEDLREMLGKIAEQKGRYADAQLLAVSTASMLVSEVDEIIASQTSVKTV